MTTTTTEGSKEEDYRKIRQENKEIRVIRSHQKTQQTSPGTLRRGEWGMHY